MFYESVPLRDAVEGGCTEIRKALHLKKGHSHWDVPLQIGAAFHPHGTSGKGIVCPNRAG